MKVRDMIDKIDFHDSNIIELLHQNNKLKLKIDLCMWKQKGYKEGDNELKEFSLEFVSVEDYMWDSDKTEADIDYDTILDISYNDGSLKIVLEDGGVSIVTFKCSVVNFM